MSLSVRLSLLAALVLGAALAWYLTSPRRRNRRGRKLVSEREASRAAKNHDGPITWGGARLPVGAETTHFLCVGTTGSGKSLTLGRLMREALEGATLGSEKRALVYDPKTEMASELAKLDMDLPVAFLNPFDRRSAEWDMSADVTSPVTALQVASILIPEEKTSANRYFTDTARDLLAELMLCFVASGSSWSLRDVVLGMRSKDRLEEILSTTERGTELFEMHAGDSRAFHNVLSTARSRLAPFEPVAALWARAETKVSLRDWIRGEMVLVLGNDDSARAAMDSLNRLIFQWATELALREPNSKTRRSWFFLDEVREAGELTGLSRLMTKGRSRGCCVALGFQDIHGLQAVYGKDVALEIVGQCSQKALLRMESEATAKWASQTIGQYEQVDVLRGESGPVGSIGSRSASEQWVTKDVVLASEFMAIPPTDMQRGLTGYYVTPHVGAYRKALPLPELLGSSVRETDVPDLMERTEDEQYLEGWGVADGVRLGLSHEAILAKEPEKAPAAQPRELTVPGNWRDVA